MALIRCYLRRSLSLIAAEICVGAVRQEYLDEFIIAMMRRLVQRREATVLLRVRIGTSVQQQPAHVIRAARGSVKGEMPSGVRDSMSLGSARSICSTPSTSPSLIASKMVRSVIRSTSPLPAVRGSELGVSVATHRPLCHLRF